MKTNQRYKRFNWWETILTTHPLERLFWGSQPATVPVKVTQQSTLVCKAVPMRGWRVNWPCLIPSVLLRVRTQATEVLLANWHFISRRLDNRSSTIALRFVLGLRRSVSYPLREGDERNEEREDD